MNRPSREDPVLGALSEVVGGPVGRRARPHPWWTPVRVLLALFTVVFALGLVQKYPCGKTDWSNEDVRYSRMCYSDVPYLYTGRGFAEHRWPYSEKDTRYPAMEYPVLISYLAWGASEITALVPSGPSDAIRAATTTGALWGLPGMTKEVNTYFLVTALLLLLCGLGTVFFLSGTSPGRPWDAMAFAASPVLLATGLVNWDLLAVLFTAGALWAWSRDRPLLAGVMVGLGTATKLYPLFLLGAFLVDVLRRRRYDLVAPAALGAVGAWVIANLPALLTGPDRWKVFWTFNSERGADLGSLWLVADQLGLNTDAHLINTVSWFGFGAACLGILVLGMRAPRRPRVAQIAFLVVAAFLIVNKVYSPQYVLWLLPLAVLARPRWRDLLIWQAGELVYFAAVWLYLGGWLAPGSGDQATTYQLAILVRVAAELYLVVLVVRDVLRGDPGYPVEPLSLPDLDGVERGRGEADPDVDLVPDRGHVGA
ncbi:glycosyltransferase family 87 protein [Marmoricola sp. RAF53]|uniref:glycosyltransferase family 87 protein n=1 Tax=Marmoricola sp. RAF53 TaxID=3233059 RepID=UPI003F980DEE